MINEAAHKNSSFFWCRKTLAAMNETSKSFQLPTSLITLRIRHVASV